MLFSILLSTETTFNLKIKFVAIKVKWQFMRGVSNYPLKLGKKITFRTHSLLIKALWFPPRALSGRICIIILPSLHSRKSFYDCLVESNKALAAKEKKKTKQQNQNWYSKQPYVSWQNAKEKFYTCLQEVACLLSSLKRSFADFTIHGIVRCSKWDVLNICLYSSMFLKFYIDVTRRERLLPFHSYTKLVSFSRFGIPFVGKSAARFILKLHCVFFWESGFSGYVKCYLFFEYEDCCF